MDTRTSDVLMNVLNKAYNAGIDTAIDVLKLDIERRSEQVITLGEANMDPFEKRVQSARFAAAIINNKNTIEILEGLKRDVDNESD